MTTGLDQDLLTRLSVDQKVALLAGADTWHTAGFDDPPVAADPHVRRAGRRPRARRGPAPASASFPCGAALGATWDPALVEEVGRALGREAHSKSANVVLAPTVNLHRTPIGGRNFECFSEDPILTAEIAVAYVAGLQGERVAACIKHFVGNDTEFERMTISSEIDERTLRELYLVPFEAAVRRADVRVVMSGYNRLNGTFCGEHHWLLTELLRDEWGFDGVVVSDWFGTHSAAASLLAGLDVEMPGPPAQRGEHLRAALERGEVASDDLDRSVARVLALADWTGAADTGTAEVTADDPETRAVIRRAAARGMVLLKNEGGGCCRWRRRRTPGGADRPVRAVRPAAGRWQRAGCTRTTGVARWRRSQARGLDVTFEPGGSIAKYLPTVRGDFTLSFGDEAGRAAEVAANRLSWYWDKAPADGIDATAFTARIAGTFVPDVTGRVGARRACRRPGVDRGSTARPSSS